MVNLTFEEWVKEFRPVDKKTGEVFTGHLLMDACLWDTYDDMQYIKRFTYCGIISEYHAWTVVGGPKSSLNLLQGCYHIDALGYLLTARSHEGQDIDPINF